MSLLTKRNRELDNRFVPFEISGPTGPTGPAGPSGSGSGGTPSDPDTSVQFNDGGSFGGSKLLYLDTGIAEFTTDNVAFQLTTPAAFGGLYIGAGTYGDPQSNYIQFQGFEEGDTASNINLVNGNGGENTNGGSQTFTAGAGGLTSGSGGNISLTAGSAQGGDSDGGDGTFFGGQAKGTGEGGMVKFRAGNSDGYNAETGGGSGAILTLNGGSPTSAGDNILQGGSGIDAAGGAFVLNGGNVSDGTGSGGGVSITGGSGGPTEGQGGSISLTAGSAQGGDSNGGDVNITAGNGTGAGDDGEIGFTAGNSQITIRASDIRLAPAVGASVQITDPSSNQHAILDTSILATTDKTFTFPNATGTLAVSAGGTGGTGSAGAGKQYIELNIGGTVYKLLHDGTV